MRRMRGSGLGAVVLVAAWLCVTPGAAQASFIFKKVAAAGDAAPDGGAYLEFRGAPSLDRGQVAFRAVAADGPSGRLGVFLSNKAGEGVGTVVDTLTAIPGGAGPFTGFGTLSLDGGQVAVIGHCDSDEADLDCAVTELSLEEADSLAASDLLEWTCSCCGVLLGQFTRSIHIRRDAALDIFRHVVTRGSRPDTSIDGPVIWTQVDAE